MKVLIFCDYYWPAFRAGGVVTGIRALVENLYADYEFYVVTSDRDLGSTRPFENVKTGQWQPIDHASVQYLKGKHLSMSKLQSLFTENDFSSIYLNSVFSRYFSIRVLLARKLRKVPQLPVILAPRGELSPSALKNKPLRKFLFLKLARALKLYSGVTWHAASDQEATQIKKQFGDQCNIKVAHDLALPLTVTSPTRTKSQDRLDIVFMARITPVKNLLYALKRISSLKNGEVQFNIYGPIEDAHYWSQCKDAIAKMPKNIRVNYKGELTPTEVAPALRQHDLLILPSQGESFGYAIAEALQCGLPVLISDKTPWKGLEQASAGWAYSLDKTQKFEEALSLCLNMNNDEFIKLRQGSLTFAESQLFSDRRIQESKQLFM